MVLVKLYVLLLLLLGLRQILANKSLLFASWLICQRYVQTSCFVFLKRDLGCSMRNETKGTTRNSQVDLSGRDLSQVKSEELGCIEITFCRLWIHPTSFSACLQCLYWCLLLLVSPDGQSRGLFQRLISEDREHQKAGSK